MKTEIEVLTDAKKIKMLREALESAQGHLEYCGYGDSWERECAKESKLADIIQNTLEQTE